MPVDLTCLTPKPPRPYYSRRPLAGVKVAMKWDPG